MQTVHEGGCRSGADTTLSENNSSHIPKSRDATRMSAWYCHGSIVAHPTQLHYVTP